MRITDTALNASGRSGAVSTPPGNTTEQRGDVDRTKGRRTPTIPRTPGFRASTTATRTTTTATTTAELAPSADRSAAAPADLSFLYLVEAYHDCRRTKRNSTSALTFERDLERNLCRLYDELVDGTYAIGRSIRFVVTRPKPREVWAAEFRDRIVHHLLYNHIAPAIEATFIADSCACIRGRGTLYAAERLEAKIRSQTQNWRRPAFYLKCDIANFFVAIDKRVLHAQLCTRVHAPWWRGLTEQVLFHDPRPTVDLRATPALLARIPPHKRLMEQPAHLGLPIGNLSSQFFANVLMDALDQHVKHTLRACHYVRYVDDFILLHESPQQLNAWRDDIAAFLERELAADLKLPIVAEFSDVVESGKDEDRPGFQSLYASLRSRERAWNHLLLLDTSRLARRPDIAIVFEEREARPRGVQLIFRNLPDIDPIWKTFLKRQMQAVDELHSMLSKQKGLAGMRENVHKGFRAGGRAPLGYKLKHEPTGAVRDGQPVLKSHLEVDASTAPAIGRYLKARAAGLPHRSAMREAGLLDTPSTTLHHLEWSALTYAGCTVWNVQNERIKGVPVAGVRRRPRADWVIKEGTHQALISREEAESILAERERRKQRRGRYRTSATYLLAGLLETPDGTPWHGNRDGTERLYYRCPVRSVRSTTIEEAVLQQISRDLRSTKFAARLAQSARAMAAPDAETDEIALAYAAIEKLDRNIEKVTALLPDAPQRPLLAQIGKWETEREKIRAGIIGSETRLRQARMVAGITESDVMKILEQLAGDMPADREALKDFVVSLVKRIVLDPVKLTCCIAYEIPAVTGNFVATPRRPVEIPRLAARALLRLKGARRAA